MVRHIVMWCFREENKEADLYKAKTDLLALKDKIPQIKDIEVGFDFSQGDASYDICLVVTVSSREDLDIYRNHPEHIKVAEFIGKVRTKRVVTDYFVE